MKNKHYFLFSALGFMIAAALTLLISLTDFSLPAINKHDVKRCTENIHDKQKHLREFINQINSKQDLDSISTKKISDDIAIFVFEGKKLIYWIHDAPVEASSLLKIDTVVRYTKLNNAWYLTRSIEKSGLNIVTTLLIKTDYPYTNESLQNTINPALGIKGDVSIESPQSSQGILIYGIDEEPLIKLYPGERTQQHSINLILRWMSVLFMLICIYLLFQYSGKIRSVPLFIAILIVFSAVLFFSGDFFKYGLTTFSPHIYSDSYFLNSLGTLFLHAIFGFLIIVFIYSRHKIWEIYLCRTTKIKRIFWMILSIAVIVAAAIFIRYILRSLVLHSCIPLEMQHPADLNMFSGVAYLILGVLYTTLFLMFYTFLQCCFPEWLNSWRKKVVTFLYLVLIPIYTVLTTAYFNREFDKHQNVIVAYKLALQHDPIAEMLLRDTKNRLNDDHIICNYIGKPDQIKDIITQHLRKYYFYGYLERYDFEVTVCNHGDDTDHRFQERIALEGDLLHENSAFYYMNNHNGRSTYMGLIHHKHLGSPVKIYVEMNSRILSNDRGYPELLLEKNVVNPIILPDSYSHAKYFNNQLIREEGSYDYPFHINKSWETKKFATIIKQDNYTHYIYKIDEERTIILSRKNDTIMNYAAAYSYLLLFFTLIFFLLSYIVGWRIRWDWHSNILRRRISLSLLSLLVFSMIIVGVGSLAYNINQYKKDNLLRMEDRMRSALSVLAPYMNELGSRDKLESQDLSSVLTHIANSFMVDINIYDINGEIKVSSRREIFNRNLQSTRMNSDAFHVLRQEETSIYIHSEQISHLQFMSIYAPFYNKNGELVAYINLPYFANERIIAEEISAMVSAYANLYILFIIIATSMGVALSNQITRPLNIIRRNMHYYERTGKLEPIEYDHEDELGDMIRSYNEMIGVLEDNTRKLAQVERESAWRDMARQIAHEIKNPLTPMRLSIQHLMRMKQNNDKGWEERCNEVAKTLLEQIDTLARTASEFSSFAKTNAEDSSIIDLNVIMQEQSPLFDNYPNITLSIFSKVSPANVKVHHEQISRVFMNILTNAVQATDEKENGMINMTLYEQGLYYCVAIEDNGSGVDKEAEAKLFTLSFTTKRSGSGLGLPICRNIIESYGGTINYRPSSIGGACFTLCIPKIT
jgi:signal transduction histidine kinase